MRFHRRFLSLALLCAGAAPLANAASFDCGKARLPDEIAICADRALNDKDVELSTKYKLLSGLLAMGVRGDMQDRQRAWLKLRRQCGRNVECLKQRYDERIGELDRVYAGIQKPL
ncbi:lysozyme inhibitor LprI family protein [Cupriavidus necator]|uniref:lysozyme inhibitor LprI family protein n=1 Tax=Cupriavidus necator TaxID=106590 RepID=UPI00339D3A68